MGQTTSMVEITAHPGPQTAFLSSAADICIYGGAAGGGKSFGLLLEALRHTPRNRDFNAVCFRRTTKQVMNPGGLWDQTFRIFPLAGGFPVVSLKEWRWKGGGKVAFGHLEYEQNKYDWQGAEVPLIMFDELTQFTRSQFFYLLSRNRSVSGVSGYIRATCNPDADSWVAELISWWIDQETGYPILDRCGVLRWFLNIDDKLIWADTRQELIERFRGVIAEEDLQPKSLTFIAAKLDDNPTLAKGDPSYRSNLLALQKVERERLLSGNWKVRPSAGLFFQRLWCGMVDAIPAGTVFVRGWDFAGTKYDGTNDPDWTSGTKIGRIPDGRFIVADHVCLRGSPHEVRTLVHNTASHDSRTVTIGIPQDAGQSGKWQVADFVKDLARYNVRSSPESGSKQVRFSPFSAQAEHGNVLILRGEWNDVYFSQLEAFPDGRHDDFVDSTSRAYNTLMEVRAPMRISEKTLTAFMAR